MLRHSTAHGVRRAGWARCQWARYSWAAVFVASSCFFGFLLFKLFQRYQEYPSKFAFEDIRSDWFLFPAVTICGQAPLATFDGLSNQQLNVIEKSSRGNHDEQQIRKVANDIAEERNENPIENFVLYSSFEGQRQNDTTSSFKRYLSELYGVCYTFNYGQSLRSTNVGPFYGLTLLLYGGDSSKRIHPVSFVDGFRLVLHKRRQPPPLSTEGFSVPLGAAAAVSLEQSDYQYLGEPYNQCDSEGVSNSGLPPCNATMYDLDISYGRWPSENHQKSLRNLLQNDEMKFEDMAFVRIFFKRLNRKVLEEKPVFDLTSVFLGVGGLSAICFGVSCLTIVEFIYIGICMLLRRKSNDDERDLIIDSEVY